MSIRKCAAVRIEQKQDKAGKTIYRCVCDDMRDKKYVPANVTFKGMCQKQAVAQGVSDFWIGSTRIDAETGKSITQDLGGFDMTPHQRKFKDATQFCKGKPNYRQCMSAQLSGGASMSDYEEGYEGYPPIEDYEGDGLGQFIASAHGKVLPSKEEFVALLISGGSAVGAAVGIKWLQDPVQGLLAKIPFVGDHLKWAWPVVKIAAAFIGGKLLYNRVHPEVGSGVALGLLVSAGLDVMANLRGEIPMLPPPEETTADEASGYSSGYGQVDIEEDESQMMGQVDIEEQQRLADFYGYDGPQIGGTTNVATAGMMGM